jgi:hypothetical protein
MKNDQDQRAPKSYTTPTLEKRAKLTDVAEGIPIVVSGIPLERG